MATRIVLTTPEVLQTTEYRPIALDIRLEEPRITIIFRGEHGTKSCGLEGAEALAAIIALNTANLSVKSLRRRLLELAVSCGVFDGVIVED